MQGLRETQVAHSPQAPPGAHETQAFPSWHRLDPKRADP